MYDVIFLSILLSKTGELKQPHVAVGQEKQLHLAAGLQSSLPSHPATPCCPLRLPQTQFLFLQSGKIYFTVPKLLCSPITT